MTQPVETTDAQENATADPVETPVSVPATPKPITEVDLQAAVERARRETQSASDKATARLHQQYQQQLRATKSAATQTLRQQGVDNPEQWEQSLDVWQKAQAFDAWQAEQGALAEWNGYVSSAATQAGLDPADPRLQNATDAVDLAAKIARAAKEDARKEVEAEKLKLKADESAALQARVDSGQLHVLGGPPAGARLTGSPAEIEQINTELADLLREPTKNKVRITQLREKRAKLKG